jgi:hypothetical protein
MKHATWLAVMERDHWSCCRCGRAAESVDHRLPRGRGGTDDLFNLQAMCGDGTRGCHGFKEHNPEQAIADGFGVHGYMLRGQYVGPDESYARHYNGNENASSGRIAEGGPALLVAAGTVAEPSLEGDDMAKRTPAERFWAKVDKSGECWVWTGSRTPKGYGSAFDGKRLRRAHRLIWEWENGPIPDGMVVCHRCDNPPCVRPSHLFLGTAADNTADMLAKGRHVAPTGLANGRAKLSAEQIAEIRARRDAGEQLRPIADDYGVSASYLSRVVRGERRVA